MNTLQTVSLLLRVGLASVFAYAAVAAFITPDNWIGYFPEFMRGIVPDTVLLTSFSIKELVLAALLLWGKWTRIVALISATLLASMVAFNLPLIDVTFRDVGLVFAALALAALETHSKHKVRT